MQTIYFFRVHPSAIVLYYQLSSESQFIRPPEYLTDLRDTRDDSKKHLNFGCSWGK